MQPRTWKAGVAIASLLLVVASVGGHRVAPCSNQAALHDERMAAAPSRAAKKLGPSVAPHLFPVTQYAYTGEVSAISVGDDYVFAATTGGLAVHRRGDGKFVSVLTTSQGLPGNGLYVVEPFAAGRLLVAGDQGAAIVTLPYGELSSSHVKVDIVDGSSRPGRFEPIYAAPRTASRFYLLAYGRGLAPLVRCAPAWCMAAREHGYGLWRAAAATELGIVRGGLDGSLQIWQEGSVPYTLHLDAPVLAIASEGYDAVVATGQSVLVLRHNRVQPVVRLLGNHEVPVLATALGRGDHGVLVGTSRGEVLLLRDGRITPLVEGLSGRVTAVAQEPLRALRGVGRVLWVGVAGSGLHRIELRRPHQARAVRPSGEICSLHVTQLAQHRGRVVAGSFDGGACYLTADGWQPLDGLPSPMVHGVVSDGDKLYVATSDGLVRYDRNFALDPITRKDPEPLQWLASIAVLATAEIAPGRLAFFSPYGFAELERAAGGTEVRWVRQQRHDVTTVAATRGRLIIGSEHSGVEIIDTLGKRLQVLRDPDKLPEAWVMDVAVADDGALWVGTCQQGIARLADGAVSWLSVEQGLVGRRVTAVLPTKGGAFVGTLSGLSWVDRGAERAVSYPRGMLPDERTSGIWQLGNEVWVATERGLAVFGATRNDAGSMPTAGRVWEPAS